MKKFILCVVVMGVTNCVYAGEGSKTGEMRKIMEHCPPAHPLRGGRLEDLILDAPFALAGGRFSPVGSDVADDGGFPDTLSMDPDEFAGLRSNDKRRSGKKRAKSPVVVDYPIMGGMQQSSAQEAAVLAVVQLLSAVEGQQVIMQALQEMILGESGKMKEGVDGLDEKVRQLSERFNAHNKIAMQNNIMLRALLKANSISLPEDSMFE